MIASVINEKPCHSQPKVAILQASAHWRVSIAYVGDDEVMPLDSHTAATCSMETGKTIVVTRLHERAASTDCVSSHTFLCCDREPEQ
jgi:hypothetical protein